MTQQETYEILRAKVYEIIYPDGIPLEFGCEVNVDDWKKAIVLTCKHAECLGEKHQNEVSIQYNDECSHVCCFPRNKINKILGKPLTLQDILRALHKKDILFEMYAAGVKPKVFYISGRQIGNAIKIRPEKSIRDQDENTLKRILNILLK